MIQLDCKELNIKEEEEEEEDIEKSNYTGCIHNECSAVSQHAELEKRCGNNVKCGETRGRTETTGLHRDGRKISRAKL